MTKAKQQNNKNICAMTSAKQHNSIVALLAALFCLNAYANNADSVLQRQYLNFKNSTQPTLALKQANELQQQLQAEGEDDYTPLYPFMGAAYESHGCLRMARNYYEKAIDNLDADQTALHMDACARMARLLMLSNPVEARVWNNKLMQQSATLSPDYHQVALFVNGMICLAVGNQYDFSQAFEAYMDHRKQHKSLDNYGLEMMQMGQLAFQGQYAEAMQLLQQATTMAGTGQLGLIDARMLLCRMMNRPDLALQWQQQRSDCVDSLFAIMLDTNLDQIYAAAGVGQAQAKATKEHERLLLSILILTLLISLMLTGWTWYVRRNRSELRQTNDQLRSALAMAEEGQKMKSEFVRSVSHEIRTPLNAISGFNDLLNTPGLELPEEERADLVQRIKDNVKAITKIVDDMLRMADKESNEFNPHSGHIYCNKFLSTVLYSYRSHVSANIELSYTTRVINRFQIATSEDGLRKILDQLIQNAIKFTTHGEINVNCETSEDGNNLFISVSDTGKGIAKENQDKVFEGFYKENAFEPGIGLGLALSKKIAQKLGGDLFIDKDYTRGARFVLSLPVEN